MPKSQWDFVLAPGADASGVLRTPASDRVQPAESAELERTWLDTFDWRLHNDGLLLEFVDDGEHCSLTLTRRDSGEQVARASVDDLPEWPDDIPAGPLREHISKLVDVRALLPVGTVFVARRTWRLLNADEKTIAVIDVDRQVRKSASPARLSPSLRVRALRGYTRQAERLTTSLAAQPGVKPSSASDAADVIASGNREPGAYTGKVAVTLKPDAGADAAYQLVLLDLLETIEVNLNGTIDDWDSEFLHDFRVAVRRSRTAVKLGRDVLPPADAERFATELKWLGDTTAPVRDADVHLLEFDAVAKRLGVDDDLEPLRDLLQDRRRADRTRLVRTLRSQRFQRFTAAYRKWLSRPFADNGAPDARRPIVDVAGERIAKTHRRLLTRGRATLEDPVAERMHDLRKRGKELRYALEFFASLYDATQLKSVVSDLKALQDVLGSYQDAHVQIGVVTEYAADLRRTRAPAATMLALGRLIAGMEREQSRALADFSGRFAAFSSRDATRRIRRMIR